MRRFDEDGVMFEVADGKYVLYADHEDRVDKAIEVAVQYGGIDGDHHKAWVIDQMVRALAGTGYDALVAEACDGEDGPDTCEWDCGTPP